MDPSARSARRRRRTLLTAAALSLTGACCVLAFAGTWRVLPAAALLAGAASAGGSAVLLRRARRGHRHAGLWTAGGAAALVYGAGQVLLGLQELGTGRVVPFPAVGDLISLGAAPFALATVVLLPRPAGPTGRLARLLPDALVVGSAGALLLWRSAFLGTGAPGGASAAAAAVVLEELSVVALLVQVAMIGLDAGVVVTGAGMALLAAGDLTSSAGSLAGGPSLLWPQALALAAAWPLICGGLLAVRPGQADRGGRAQARAEGRASVTTTGLLAASAAGVALTARGEALDVVSTTLLVVLLVLFTVRDLVLQHQRVRHVGSLSHAADHDPLTGLGNRRALRAALDSLVGDSLAGDPLAGDAPPASVLVLDLDGFKGVNDRLGHATGDALLVAVAEALGAAAPAPVRAFRLGGDEFALLAPCGQDELLALAGEVAGAVRSAAAAVPGVHQTPLSASCGVVALHAADLDGGDPMTAVSQASTAMQAAKRAGRDRVVLYTGEVAAAARRSATVEQRLRGALERGQLQAHLQPVVDVASGSLCGFEALARWHDAELGDVAPGEFIPVAERTGLVVPLGAAVLRRGLAALVACGGVDRRLTLAVNASPVELRSPTYAAGVQAALDEHGVPADLLVVEVTEAVLVAEDDPALGTLAALGAMGAEVAVDDFGTGYSSLSYLARLPVHVLKIDRSLTAALDDPRTRAVVDAVVAMSRALGIEVVAEGVELPEQARALAGSGVRRGQGWLWSPALAPEDAAALVGRGPAVPARLSPAAAGPRGRPRAGACGSPPWP